mgnify:CR=1 FL=1
MEVFNHITTEERAAAVAGFVRHNPRLKGIDFDTMMDMIIDTDSHLVVVGDGPFDRTAASHLVSTLAALTEEKG